MNKTIKFILGAALLIMGKTAVNAQPVYTAADGTEYQFSRHAFLNVEAGVQHTLGETKFKDLLSPNVQVGLGYQFSPVVGARVQVNGWQSKGGWNTQIANAYKFNYVAPGLDLMFNLSNLLYGWNPDRLLSVTAFVGGGANIAWGNDEVNEIAQTVRNRSGYLLEYLWDGSKVRPFGRGGVELGFRLSNAVSLLVEGNANFLSDKYNSKKAGNSDWYFNGLVGLRFNLGKTRTKVETPVQESVPLPVPEPEPQPVVTPTPEPRPVTQPVVEKVEPLRRDVFFEINKWDVRPEEQPKVKDIADYLSKYPKSKVSVTGYADAGTGNDPINDLLAARRADAVVTMLREQYGVSSDRISYDSKGARVQPFTMNDQNRVSVCIAE